MQNMTETLKTAIRGTYQVPLCHLEIYNSDGIKEKSIYIDSDHVTISAASSRKILRTISISLDNKDGQYTIDPTLFEQNVLWYDKTIQVYFGYMTGNHYDTEEYLPQGRYTIDSLKYDNDPTQSTIEIEGSDFMSKLIDDAYDDVFKITGTATETEDYAAKGTASASSSEEPDTAWHASQALDNADNSFWTPDAPNDPAPWWKVDLGGQKAINVIYISLGDSVLDYWKRHFYRLEYSSDNVTWNTFTDQNGYDVNTSAFAEMEHVVNEVTCRYIRMSFDKLESTRRIKVRKFRALKITATQTVDKVLRDIANAAGITETSFPITRRYIKAEQAALGEAKERLPRLLANAIGWKDPYFDEWGVYRSHVRDINPAAPAWEFSVETDNIIAYSPRFTNEVYNVIIVVYKSSDNKTIVGRAIDDDPESPTSVQKMGRRVKTYENQKYNAQWKVNRYAARKLFERTRMKHQTTITVTGHPGLQIDDLIHVYMPDMKSDSYEYVITGFEFEFDAEGSFETRYNISQLDQGFKFNNGISNPGEDEDPIGEA